MTIYKTMTDLGYGGEQRPYFQQLLVTSFQVQIQMVAAAKSFVTLCAFERFLARVNSSMPFELVSACETTRTAFNFTILK